jgi:2-keto-4-pentenoate hydratase/2-oxohepta-3-ene-1,7-dioic acid hydratase in catechol pathway
MSERRVLYRISGPRGLAYALCGGDGALRLLHGDPLLPPPEAWEETGEELPFGEATLLPPTVPTKIVGFARTYEAHAEERQKAVPGEPLLFLKPPSSLLAPGGTILLPPESSHVDHEGELAVLIGRTAWRISPAEAEEAILGYTAVNDVTARDIQAQDGHFGRAKGFDTFCPVGPGIVHRDELDPSDLAIEARVDGEIKQQGRTSHMVWSPPELVAFASRVMTLQRGDLVLTGTPRGVSPLADGMVVEVEVEGIPVLRNRVADVPEGEYRG